jgi:hypothetical protein
MVDAAPGKKGTHGSRKSHDIMQAKLSFPRWPSNWPRVPLNPDEKTWKADRELLREEHGKLLDVVRSVPLDRLFEIPHGGKSWTAAELIIGIAEHDTYHTAQIQLLKRLWKSRK